VNGEGNVEEIGVGNDLDRAQDYHRMEGQTCLLGRPESTLDQEPAMILHSRSESSLDHAPAPTPVQDRNQNPPQEELQHASGAVSTGGHVADHDLVMGSGLDLATKTRAPLPGSPGSSTIGVSGGIQHRVTTRSQHSISKP
jgi:hypothetical protein